MSVDLNQSRRGYNEYCRYWKRNEGEENTPDEIIYKRIPSGSFWAREVSPEQLRNNIVGGTFMFDSSHVTIKSPDNCEELKNEDLVEYQGEMWLVVSVQKSLSRKGQTMFTYDKYSSHYWYIELRK